MISIGVVVPRFAIEEKSVDQIRFRILSNSSQLLLEKNQSRFIGCNIAHAQHYYSKYGRDISPDAISFKQKALEVLTEAVTALDYLNVRFWLSSGTCLGELPHCYCINHDMS